MNLSTIFFFFVTFNVVMSVADNCYGAVFDAGSSGTRLHMFRWPCRRNDHELIRFDKTFKVTLKN